MTPWVHIIGGGLAGLSLGSELGRFKKLPGDVIISEPKPTNLKQRTFSYWFREQERLMLYPEFTANVWRLGTPTSLVDHVGQMMIYGTSTGEQVYRHTMKLIEAHPQIHIQSESIQVMPKATHVFDSRPCAIESFKIIQSFSGIEIELPKAHGINAVDLMKSIETTSTGIRFLYKLPLGPTRILIEHTEFTTSPASFNILDSMNIAYIKNTFGTDYREIRKERAHIPMGFRHLEKSFGISIGARAGMTRDATGYGYKTIKKFCRKTAMQLVRDNRTQIYQPSRVARWTDKMFLDLLSHRPDTIPDILVHIGRKMTGDQFAQFMAMSSPLDILRVISAAPLKPFALSLIGGYRWI